MFQQNIGRAQRSIGRAQMNIGRAWALPGLYKTTLLVTSLVTFVKESAGYFDLPQICYVGPPRCAESAHRGGPTYKIWGKSKYPADSFTKVTRPVTRKGRKIPPHTQGLRHRGTGGTRPPPIFESAGDNPPHFQENSGPNPLSFRLFLYGLPSEENPGFTAAWSPSPHFHRRGGAPAHRGTFLESAHRGGPTYQIWGKSKYPADSFTKVTRLVTRKGRKIPPHRGTFSESAHRGGPTYQIWGKSKYPADSFTKVTRHVTRKGRKIPPHRGTFSESAHRGGPTYQIWGKSKYPADSVSKSYKACHS